MSTGEISNPLAIVPTWDFDGVLRFEIIKLRACVCGKMVKVRELPNYFLPKSRHIDSSVSLDLLSLMDQSNLPENTRTQPSTWSIRMQQLFAPGQGYRLATGPIPQETCLFT